MNQRRLAITTAPKSPRRDAGVVRDQQEHTSVGGVGGGATRLLRGAGGSFLGRHCGLWEMGMSDRSRCFEGLDGLSRPWEEAREGIMERKVGRTRKGGDRPRGSAIIYRAAGVDTGSPPVAHAPQQMQACRASHSPPGLISSLLRCMCLDVRPFHLSSRSSPVDILPRSVLVPPVRARTFPTSPSGPVRPWASIQLPLAASEATLPSPLPSPRWTGRPRA